MLDPYEGHAQDIEPGDIILACEGTETNTLDVAEVKSVKKISRNDLFYGHGQPSNNVMTAKYTPVLTHTDAQGRHQVIIWKLWRNQICELWTWKICHDDFSDLVLAQGISLRKS